MPVKCYTGYLQVVVGEHKVVKTQVLLFLPLEFATILSAKHKTFNGHNKNSSNL